MASRLVSTLRRGASRLKGFSFPGVSNGGNWTLWGGLLRTLPGAEFDYRREAGILWENSVVRIGLKWMEDTFQEPMLVAKRRGKDGKFAVIPGANAHPLVALLDTPNPFYDGATLQAGIVLSLACDGNAYLFKMPGPFGNTAGLVYIPHYQMEPEGGGPMGWIGRYAYKVNGKTTYFAPEEILHLRDGYDPGNAFKGLSRLGASMREICSINEASTFSAAMLRNSGVPTLMVSRGDKADSSLGLSEEQIEGYKDKFRSFTRDGRGGVWIDDSHISVTKIGFSPEELVLDKIVRMPTSVVCASLNIDPMVLGLPSDQKTYSNFAEANVAAYYQCVIPHLRLIDRQLTRELSKEVVGVVPGDILGRDYSDVKALEESQDSLFTRLGQGYQDGWLKRSDARSGAGYQVDADDEVYLTDLVNDRVESVTPEQDPAMQ